MQKQNVEEYVSGFLNVNSSYWHLLKAHLTCALRDRNREKKTDYVQSWNDIFLQK